MSWLFLGPQPFSGIGFVNKKYCDLVGGDYLCYEDKIPKGKKYDNCFCFILPLDYTIEYAKRVSQFCNKMFYMTVCETETVHPDYAKLIPLAPMFTPSEFAKNILERQFPEMRCTVLRHFAAAPESIPTIPGSDVSPYTFYTIGNISDPRKNIDALIHSFGVLQRKLGTDKIRLVLKATCKKSISINFPGIVVINGLLDENTMEKIHASCHCYVNCSHSEGVGMGAVEAALRNKPVIITDYGGLKEYVKTPFVVKCRLGDVGMNDFLFTKDMKWGHFKLPELISAMEDCYNRNVRSWSHEHTASLMPTPDAFCNTCHTSLETDTSSPQA